VKRRGGKLTIRADPNAVSMAATIRAAAGAAPLFILTGRAFGDLSAELGGFEAAAGYLHRVAVEIGRPIGINFETGTDTSKTVFTPPKGWSEQKLAGWIAGHHQELEGEFGQVSRIGPGWPEEGNRR
jgi:hypothetical protein